MPKKGELTPKQSLFVKEYLIDLNACAAAIRAGYSKKTADVIGCQNLGKLNIQREINKAMKKRSDKIEVTADRVLKELSRLAFLDIRKLYKKDGALKEIKDLDDDTAAAIGGLDVVISGGEYPSETKKIKIIDKKGSLELLGRHLKMFTDTVDHNHSGKITMETILQSNDQGGLPAISDKDE